MREQNLIHARASAVLYVFHPKMDVGMLTRIEEFKKFRESLYSFFPKRPDAIMNLLDALSSFGHQARSVVELSEAECFERQYSSITDAIADGLPKVDWSGIERHLFHTMIDYSKEPLCFLLDCTPNPRPFAKTLQDRSITHCPNPAPGNKPICVGHAYSCIALLPADSLAHDKKWLIPLSMRRVPSNVKGHEMGMQQLLEHLTQLNLGDQLAISVTDSLYGSEECRRIASIRDTLVDIFRIRNNRNVYSLPDHETESKMRGRKKEYGQVMSLAKSSTHPKVDEHCEIEWQASNGRIYTVKIDAWYNKLFRGSKKFRSSQHPITLLRVCLVDQQGNPLFKKQMWLGVQGKQRDQLSLSSISQYYRSRYNIEHFFRFGKTKLLLDKYQTPESTHDESWWKFCLLAYSQLYMARSLVPQKLKPWERYLPEYRERKDTKASISTASQTQRGFAELLKDIGTPAKPCVARGRNSGRKKGECVGKRVEQEIKFKPRKNKKSEQKIIIPGFENTDANSNPEKIQTLINTIITVLKKLNITTASFTQMLCDTS